MKANIKDKDGKNVEVPITPTLYQEAHEANQTVPQYLANRFETDAALYGSAFEQVCASSGLILGRDRAFGIRPPTVKAILEGTAGMSAGAITRDAVPASRVLFPAVILEVIENQLAKERTSQPAIFDQMIAIDDTIAGDRIEQPVLDFQKPEAARSQGIAQLALPAAMLRVTASDISKKIPVFSLGMEMSDEAAKVVTVDLTALALSRQVAVEKDLRVEEYITAFVNGDADQGYAALTATTSTSLDAAATGGVLTQKAWVKWLAQNRRKRTIDFIICDIDTALKIDARTNRPVVTQANDPNWKINSTPDPLNLSLQNVKMFIVEVGVIATNTVVGLDSRHAIRRIRNSEAEYKASEQFALRKGIGLRFDFGEMAYRLFDDAWDVLTIL